MAPPNLPRTWKNSSVDEKAHRKNLKKWDVLRFSTARGVPHFRRRPCLRVTRRKILRKPPKHGIGFHFRLELCFWTTRPFSQDEKLSIYTAWFIFLKAIWLLARKMSGTHTLKLIDYSFAFRYKYDCYGQVGIPFYSQVVLTAFS